MNRTGEHPPSPAVLQRGYELPDINSRAMVLFFIVFVLLGVGIHYGVWYVMDVMLHQTRSIDVVTSAAPVPDRFPAPNLQPVEKHNQMPEADLADLRREKNAMFQQMGWNVESNISPAHIPDSIVEQLSQERATTAPATGGAK